MCVSEYACVCVCVCEKEREGERVSKLTQKPDHHWTRNNKERDNKVDNNISSNTAQKLKWMTIPKKLLPS